MERVFSVLFFLAALAGCRESCTLGMEEMGRQLEDTLERLAGGREQRRAVVREMTRSARDDYQRVLIVNGFLAELFDWTATDYQERTIEEILRRRGGNCSELARVTVALLEDLDLRVRTVRDVNIHVESERRQRNAEEKVREKGPRMSVFGRRHNDHVWIEVYDRTRRVWFPVDPSLGIAGEEEWLSFRLGFGKRVSPDPAALDMIAPFAVFAFDGNGQLLEDRTRYYLIERFDALYQNQLRELKPWPEWVRLVESLSAKALKAFEGSLNLHEYASEIDELAEVYAELKAAYLPKQPR